MKHTLKGWLVDNAVTVDNKEDKILMLESAGSLTLEDILSAMKKEDTGLREETIEHAVKLYHRVLSDLILSGYSVNTGLFRAVPQFRGVVDGGQWDQKKEFNLRLLYPGQGLARSYCADFSQHLGRETGRHVYNRWRRCRHPCHGRHGNRRTQLHPERTLDKSRW